MSMSPPQQFSKSVVSKSSTLRTGRGLFVRKYMPAHSLWASFGYAWEGLKFVYETERNFRIHLLIAAVALGMSAYLKISALEWVMIGGLIGFVLCAELINSGVEHLVDLITEGNFHPRAKWIKDIFAASVFIAAITAAACGALIFLPHIFH